MSQNLNSYDYANIFNTYKTSEGYEFYNLINSINIEGDLDASLYDFDVVYDFRSWYELSNKYYGTPRLWWILLVANKIQNPFDVTSGQRVKILKPVAVTQIVSQINNS